MGGDRLYGCVVHESRGIVSLFPSPPFSLSPSLSFIRSLSFCRSRMPIAHHRVAPPPAALRCIALRCAARCNCSATQRSAARYSPRTKVLRSPGVSPRKTGLTSSVWTEAGGIYSDIQWLEKSISAHKRFLGVIFTRDGDAFPLLFLLSSL